MHYPFALLKSYILHQPCKAIGIGLDTSRVGRNASGQIVYNSATAVRPADVVWPSSINDTTETLTSGTFKLCFMKQLKIHKLQIIQITKNSLLVYKHRLVLK